MTLLDDENLKAWNALESPLEDVHASGMTKPVLDHFKLTLLGPEKALAKPVTMHDGICLVTCVTAFVGCSFMLNKHNTTSLQSQKMLL